MTTKVTASSLVVVQDTRKHMHMCTHTVCSTSLPGGEKSVTLTRSPCMQTHRAQSRG